MPKNSSGFNSNVFDDRIDHATSIEEFVRDLLAFAEEIPELFALQEVSNLAAGGCQIKELTSLLSLSNLAASGCQIRKVLLCSKKNAYYEYF